jgi:hypothetical protein
VRGNAAEPHLHLCREREHGCERPVEPQRVGPQASQGSEEHVHDVTVNGWKRPVIGRPADSRPPKDQPAG